MKIFDNLKKYFETTDPKQVEKDWKEVESLNDLGPDVLMYDKLMKKKNN